MNPICRLYRPEDAESIVRLTRQAFPFIQSIPVEFWARLEEKDHLTVVAEDQGNVVGAIPFDIRQFLIRPEVSVQAAFAHLVCVDQDYRGKGVGSSLMNLARQELPKVCNGMFVYTGHEGRQPYTFYERNQFIDMLYNREYVVEDLPATAPADIKVVPFVLQQWDQEELNQVYQQAYGNYAGFPRRYPGFWSKGFASVIYVELPMDFYIAFSRAGSRLTGYAILGAAENTLAILELTPGTWEGDLCQRLLRACIAFARSKGLKQVRTYGSYAHPIVPSLEATGFRAAPRASAEIIAAQMFHFDRLWPKLAGENPEYALQVWTPGQTLNLPGQGRTIHLEMKEATLNRLFLCRENIRYAIESEWITSPDRNLPLDWLASVFQPTAWIYHFFDWI